MSKKEPDPVGGKNKPNAVNIHVGARLCAARVIKGITQRQLAAALDVTWQQLQKYETGKNQMSPVRLWDAAKTLKVQVQYFFDDMGDEEQSVDTALFNRRASLELVRNYWSCDEKAQKHLLAFSRDFADRRKMKNL